MPVDPEMAQHFIIIGEIIQSCAVMIGIVLLVGAIFQLKKYGEMRSMMSGQMSLSGPLMMFVAASALLSLPFFINASLLAFEGYTNPMSLSSDIATDWPIEPILIFVRVVGVASFVRGLVLLSRSGQHQGQPGNTGKAIIHMIAGVLCIHVIGSYELLKNIFF